MKRLALSFIAIILIFVLSACSTGKGEQSQCTCSGSNCSAAGSTSGGNFPSENPQELEDSVIRAYRIPEGVDKYDGAVVTANGQVLDVYNVKVNTSQNWVGSENDYRRTDSGVCMFELKGKAEIIVKPTVQIDYTSVIRPLSARLTAVADIEQNTISITFKSAGEYVLEINGDVHNVIHFFVSDLEDDASPDKYEGYNDVIVFDAGLHTAQNDNRIDGGNNIYLGSSTLVYLADGAVVRGRFVANNAENIAIVGRGVIDGSTFSRDATRGTVTVPVEFNYCKNLLLKDFSVLDPAGWTINFYFIENSKIDNVKIITSRSNGDGISLQSCKHIEVDGCFVRSWDDSLVVKNYPRWDNRSVYGETEDITFTNCTLWTDLAQSMELGYETVGEKFEDITFENITVLHALNLAAISIHNANNAEIKGVTFKDITIEDAKAPAESVGIVDLRVLYSATWSDQHTAPTALGNVDGVVIENINILSARWFKAQIGGCYDYRTSFEGDRYVDNVTIKNVAVGGVMPTREESRIEFTSTKHVRGFNFVQEEGYTVTGARFISSQTDEELARYGKTLRVTII